MDIGPANIFTPQNIFNENASPKIALRREKKIDEPSSTKVITTNCNIKSNSAKNSSKSEKTQNCTLDLGHKHQLIGHFPMQVTSLKLEILAKL